MAGVTLLACKRVTMRALSLARAPHGRYLVRLRLSPGAHLLFWYAHGTTSPRDHGLQIKPRRRIERRIGPAPKHRPPRGGANRRRLGSGSARPRWRAASRAG